MAEEVGMRPRLILGRLDAMSKRILEVAHRLAKEMDEAWPSEVYAKIKKVIVGQLNAIGYKR